MTSQIRGLEVGIRNANDAISMLSTADGALVEVTNMLQRMRELAVQASNGTTTEDDRNYLNAEYANLISEIERIAQNTQWNGKDISRRYCKLLGDSTVAFQVGANGGQTIAVDFGDAFTNGASGIMHLLCVGAAHYFRWHYNFSYYHGYFSDQRHRLRYHRGEHSKGNVWRCHQPADLCCG